MPIDPITGAAIVSGVTNVGSSMIQNFGNRNSQRRANKYNVAFWEKQNAYNHPIEQRKRLTEAGLNPNLIYGTGGSTSVGNADAIAPSKPADYEMRNPLQDITKFSQVKSTEAQTNNFQAQLDVLRKEAQLKDSQIHNTNAQTSNTLANTLNTETNTARGKFDLGLATELRNTNLEIQKAQLGNLQQSVIGNQLDNRFKDQTLSNRAQNIALEVQNAQENLSGTTLQNALKRYELELNKIGLQKTDPLWSRIMYINKNSRSRVLGGIKQSLLKPNTFRYFKN